MYKSLDSRGRVGLVLTFKFPEGIEEIRGVSMGTFLVSCQKVICLSPLHTECIGVSPDGRTNGELLARACAYHYTFYIKIYPNYMFNWLYLAAPCTQETARLARVRKGTLGARPRGEASTRESITYMVWSYGFSSISLISCSTLDWSIMEEESFCVKRLMSMNL